MNDPYFDKVVALRLLPRHRKDFIQQRQMAHLEQRDPEAPRLPPKIMTRDQFMLGDDGEGLPLPFNPIKRFGLDK